MRIFIVGLVLLFSVAGCAGVKLIGIHTLRDGSIKEFVQVTTDLEYGPAMRVIEGIRYNKVTDKEGNTIFVNPQLESRYSSAGSGIINSLVDSSIPAAVTGVFALEAAKARRPNITTVTQDGGDATSTSAGGDAESSSQSNALSSSESSSQSNALSSSESSASTIQHQTQGQDQDQNQDQNQDQQIEGGEGGTSCRGNCSPGGNNGQEN